MDELIYKNTAAPQEFRQEEITSPARPSCTRCTGPWCPKCRVALSCKKIHLKRAQPAKEFHLDTVFVRQ